MDQYRNLADDRLVNGCIYCGAQATTREHVPCRALLDSPYPENLPVVGSCSECNRGFSADEQYLACITECVIAGTTDPAMIRRRSVAAALTRSPALRARIESGRVVSNGQTAFRAENDRVARVLLKLARGHAAFELAQVRHDEPTSFWWTPLELLSGQQRDEFESLCIINTLGEIGSRAHQRVLVLQATLTSPTGDTLIQELLVMDWVDVQENRYRYLAVEDMAAIRIKIVIAEYLACEVTWDASSP